MRARERLWLLVIGVALALALILVLGCGTIQAGPVKTEATTRIACVPGEFIAIEEPPTIRRVEYEVMMDEEGCEVRKLERSMSDAFSNAISGVLGFLVRGMF